jgi:hypothetical protein
MPKCEFSETQFSFCYTFEFIESYCPWSIIPYFPNTYIEGQPGHGFDVRIDGHLYFQFKIPKHITQQRIANTRQWETFNKAFYRCKINTDEEQYKLLKQLKNPDNEVFYITPDFHENRVISSHYHTRQIVNNSAVFSIDDLPPYLSGLHSMCYIPGIGFGKMFSEPIEVKRVNILERIVSINQREKAALNQVEEAKRIQNILIEMKELPEVPNLQQFENNYDLIKAIRGTLLSYFNILWTPIISRQAHEIFIQQKYSK